MNNIYNLINKNILLKSIAVLIIIAIAGYVMFQVGRNLGEFIYVLKH